MAKAKFNAKGKSKRDSGRVVGDARQTQLITTYGVGAIVNFVKDTVIVAGIDGWDKDKNPDNSDNIDYRKIFNENLQSLTGAKYFIEPKISGNSGPGWLKSKDIPAFVFPEMLRCPKCKKLVAAKEAANANPKKPNRCFLDRHDGTQCNGVLIASRFVVVCENGHMEDFPYEWWVHGNTGCQSDRTPRMSMYNIGDRNDIDSLFVKCETCGKTRGMNGAFAAFAFSGENGYPCSANHPHLKNKKAGGGFEPECDKTLKTRLFSSSGVYFAATASALLIPPWSGEAVKIIERKYEELGYMSDPEPYLRSKASPTVTLAQLLAAYDMLKTRKDSDLPRGETEIYHDEYKILSQGESGDNLGDYSAFAAEIPIGFEQYFERVTVVDRLTVTESLMGFTRLKPWGGDTDERQLAPLSAEPKEWLPAVQLRGEGIFIQFKENAVETWKKNIKNRYEKMERQLGLSYLKSRLDRFSPEYVMLHTFAHLLIRQLADECGYSAASMKEKIYSTFNAFSETENNAKKMRGILIYLASSDCDGSLGGLISIAQDSEKFRVILENMLQKAAWCSGDPLCAASDGQGFDSLNYSACHNCALLPETSCEFRNVLLDRVSVVGTPEEPPLGFLGN